MYTTLTFPSPSLWPTYLGSSSTRFFKLGLRRSLLICSATEVVNAQVLETVSKVNACSRGIPLAAFTANWEADSSQRWTVPLGGGAGRLVKFGKQPVDFRLQTFWYGEEPDNGPDWALQLQVKRLFPKSKKVR